MKFKIVKPIKKINMSIHKSECVAVKEQQPLMIELLNSLKNRVGGLEMVSAAIKTRVSYIDGNVPPNPENVKETSANGLYEEMQRLYGRLSSIEQTLDECNNRLSNQLG